MSCLASQAQVRLAEALMRETDSAWLDVSRMTLQDASCLIDRLKARKKEMGIR